MKKTLLAVLGIGMMFTACKKEDLNPVPTTPTTPPPALTLKQQLMAKPVSVIAWEARSAADTSVVIDFYEYFVDLCSRDDRFYFMGGDSLRISEHTVVCPDSEPNTYGQWRLNETTRQLTTDFMGDAISGTLSRQGDTAFVVAFPIEFFGDTYNCKMVYRQQ